MSVASPRYAVGERRIDRHGYVRVGTVDLIDYVVRNHLKDLLAAIDRETASHS